MADQEHINLRELQDNNGNPFKYIHSIFQNVRRQRDLNERDITAQMHTESASYFATTIGCYRGSVKILMAPRDGENWYIVHYFDVNIIEINVVRRRNKVYAIINFEGGAIYSIEIRAAAAPLYLNHADNAGHINNDY